MNSLTIAKKLEAKNVLNSLKRTIRFSLDYKKLTKRIQKPLNKNGYIRSLRKKKFRRTA